MNIHKSFNIIFFILFVNISISLSANNINDILISKLNIEIKNWKLSDKVLSYDVNTLFEYINGAAESYLLNYFQKLYVIEYFLNEENKIKVEIYQHKSPVYAFGIYSQERPTRGNFMQIGTEGYSVDNGINFLSGSYYIKAYTYINLLEVIDILVKICQDITSNLSTINEFPAILKVFPEEGKIDKSEKFISKSYLGYEFLPSAFEASYEIDENEFIVFIIESEEIQKVFDDYKAKALEIIESENVYYLTDKYIGEIVLDIKNNYLYGIHGKIKKETALRYMNMIHNNLDHFEK
ncbi:MAG: hypothetical protein JXB17_04715 [Bacteroidales bacterium]|nr:hypothetical protein [Bacteroidales bacterium]